MKTHRCHDISDRIWDNPGAHLLEKTGRCKENMINIFTN